MLVFSSLFLIEFLVKQVPLPFRRGKNAKRQIGLFIDFLGKNGQNLGFHQGYYDKCLNVNR